MRDLPAFGADCWLLVHRVRVACPLCGPKLEELPWLEPYARVTTRLAESVAKLCRVLPVKHVAAEHALASLFLAFEPLAGWRHVAVTDHRRRLEWASFIKALLDGRYQQAEKIVLVMDQLNTHSAASLYEAFPPAEARRLAGRLEIHHTPKHGSWLNMAEIELSALGRQCLAQRIDKQERPAAAIRAWEKQRNANTCKVQWQFTTADARIKLQRLYPSIDG